MYFSYVLKSIKDGKYYYGSTQDLSKRLKAHNSGKVRSTKYRTPLKLIYYEEFESRSLASKRELFYKSIDGYNWLKSEKIIYPDKI